MGVGPSDDLLLALDVESVVGASGTSDLLLSCGSSSSFSGLSSGNGDDESAGRSFHLAVTVEKVRVDVGNECLTLRASRGEPKVDQADRDGLDGVENGRAGSIDLHTLHREDLNASLHGRFCPYSILRERERGNEVERQDERGPRPRPIRSCKGFAVRQSKGAKARGGNGRQVSLGLSMLPVMSSCDSHTTAGLVRPSDSLVVSSKTPKCAGPTLKSSDDLKESRATLESRGRFAR